jgi:hypothetical protein
MKTIKVAKSGNAKRLLYLLRHQKWTKVEREWLLRHTQSEDVRHVIEFRLWELTQASQVEPPRKIHGHGQ